jgi:hypothetical protein
MGCVAALLASAAALAMPSIGSASFGFSAWETATCGTDVQPNTDPQVPPDPAECTYASPQSQLFTQVGGRANFLISHFAFNTKPNATNPDQIEADGRAKDVRVDLPPGLTINPQAAAKCTEATLESQAGEGDCGVMGARVGSVFVEASAESLVTGGKTHVRTVLPVFNIVPKPGEPAELGFGLSAIVPLTVFLDGNVDWAGDYHQGVTIHVPEPGLAKIGIIQARLSLDRGLGGNSLVSLGSNCQGSLSSTINADAWENPATLITQTTVPLGPGHVIQPTGCDLVPFAPSFSAGSSAAATDSPTSLAVSVGLPFEAAAPIAQAHLRRAEVTLPAGMGLNPAAAGRLAACTDAQFPRHVALGDPFSDPAAVHPPPISCPAASQIGTAAIETPLLPETLSGSVYLARQLSRDPASGNEYRVFLDASSPRYGVYVRLAGQIAADPRSGRLTATFDDPAEGGLPQVPFRSLELFLGGGLLSTPGSCGAHAIAARLSPWSGGPAAGRSDSFALSSAPGPGGCPATLAARPFAPAFKAAVDDPRAGAYSPLRIRVERQSGEQELKGADFTLPAGQIAKLAGVPYCPEAALGAAASAAGAAERDHPSCPAQSRVGSVAIAAGTGPAPLQIPGSVYLAGPYRGAPLSLAVIAPALAGPFDLGVAVVRVALFLDPESARIHAVSDPLPDVFGGAKLDLRSLALDLDRPSFALNGTNCEAAAGATGALRGGGADPADPAAFSSFAVSAPLRVGGCEALPFKPKLSLRLSGARKRAQHAKLKVTLKARPGDANLKSAQVALPGALILDQGKLAAVCTRAQFAAESCPAKSVYGSATATSPLLDQPLKGNLYLRSSAHKLPDLVAHLKGQITVDLDGRIDTYKGGIRTSFASLPDVPIQSFSLTIPGGRRGLLEASTDLCKGPVRALVALGAQNGKKVGKRLPLKVGCHRK